MNWEQAMESHTIDNFNGEFAFLSNFYPAANRYAGLVYPTVEHAFQAAKTQDDTEKRQIAAAHSPGQAKRLGRAVRLRPDWESVKVAVMTELVREKFATHPELRERLLATGDAELIEGNTWNDRFWGVSGGFGKNWLGRILMQVRQELRPAESKTHPGR
jgi:N-glycosidase YbiA